MGIAASWIAVHGRDSRSVISDLGLRVTGKAQMVFEHPIVGMDIGPRGYLVAFADINDDLVHTSVPATLSLGCDVLVCHIQEHTMHSMATLWRNGAVAWAIEHNAQLGILHLMATGRLPASYERIRSWALAQQEEAGGEAADVDYIFDVPPLVAWRLTGFKHDRRPIVGRNAKLEILERTNAVRSKPWWMIW